MNRLLRGVLAGSAGTTALNVSTYLDMAVRGRGASSMPEKAAGHLADSAGVGLRREGESDDAVSNRRSGLGALMGYLTGVGTATGYALVAPTSLRRRSVPVQGAVIGAAAMVGSDVPMTTMGLTDPRTWGRSGWLSDIVPHALYGLVVAATLTALDRS